METLVQTLDKNLIIGLLLLLVIFPVYYKMGLLNWIVGKGNDGKPKIKDDLSSKMTQLQQHYNHDTTRDLELLMTEQKTMKESIVRIENTLNNFEKFGIKIRKE